MKKKYLLTELKILWHTKLLLVFIIAVMGCSVAIYFCQYVGTIEGINDYNSAKDLYEENDNTFESDIQGDYKIEETDDGGVWIENPAKYYYVNACDMVFSCGPAYAFSFLCESGLLIFPLFFGLLGILYISTDFRNRTIKLHVARKGRLNYLYAKIVTLILMDVFYIGCFCLFYYIASAVIQKPLFEMTTISWDELIEVVGTEAVGNNIVHILVSLMNAITYSILGFSLAMVFKTAFLPTLSLGALYLLPSKSFGYGFTNVYNTIISRTCACKGIVKITNITPINLNLGVMIVLCLVAGMTVLDAMIMQKRSAYC